MAMLKISIHGPQMPVYHVFRNPQPTADSPREPQHPFSARFPPFTGFSDFSVIFSPYFGLDAAGLEIVCFPLFPAAIVVYALRCSSACRTRRAHTASRPHAPRVGHLPLSLSFLAAPSRWRLSRSQLAPLVGVNAARDRPGRNRAKIGQSAAACRCLSKSFGRLHWLKELSFSAGLRDQKWVGCASYKVVAQAADVFRIRDEPSGRGLSFLVVAEHGIMMQRKQDGIKPNMPVEEEERES
ncbi:uncharacterized protein LOC116511999 [Thamnophis elegans]|uniref:uncharacterized protein LOC116511999 n=1 Tax=Thamnophis elegans TaxID=35005 RepID=UPI0013779663|nr:uncharacterized protein LOC116511999 [Thamnophis elegans]